MRHRIMLALAVALMVLLPPAPAQAIVNGQPDNGEHPYVGQLFFYVPDAIDDRFDDPGGWFNCSGSLISPTIVVTAGHCTYGTGLNGMPTTAADGDGGNDVWFSTSEATDYSFLPPSTDFVPDGNAARYDMWSSLLDRSSDWHEVTAAHPHPAYDDAAFFEHDAGVLVLEEPIYLEKYAQLPGLGLLDRLAKDPQRIYTPVGYGLEGSSPKSSFGGDTRRTASVTLVSVNGAYGTGDGVAAKFSGNNGKPHTGGTCFGDSGGPILVGGTDTIVAVNSFGISSNCKGGGGGYRLDQVDDLDFIGTYFQPAATTANARTR